MWKARTQRGAKPVGRVYTIHPSAGDVFYLRTLLHNVTGEELGLANGIDWVEVDIAKGVNPVLTAYLLKRQRMG